MTGHGCGCRRNLHRPAMPRADQGCYWSRDHGCPRPPPRIRTSGIGGVSPNRRNFRRWQTFRFSMLGVARWDGKTPQQRRIDLTGKPWSNGKAAPDWATVRAPLSMNSVVSSAPTWCCRWLRTPGTNCASAAWPGPTAYAPPQGFGILEMAKSSHCTAQLGSEPE